MSRASKLFKVPLPSQSAPATNRAGHPAWINSLEMDFLTTLLCNTLGNTFYADQKEMIAESAKLHAEMLVKDPDFYAKALVFARNEGLMRLQPLYGLVQLWGVLPEYAENVFDKVILYPDDLTDFMTIYSAEHNGSQGGRHLKRVVGRWLIDNLNPYWVIKYGAGAGYSLKNLIITMHPNLGTKAVYADYLIGRNPENLPEQIRWFEKLKNAKTSAEKVDAIINGKIPVEVASSFAGDDPDIWKAIAPNLPITALVRHLETLSDHKALDANRKMIEDRLTDVEAIRKSRILPYQLLRAYKKVTSAWAVDALRGAVDAAFDSIQAPDGETMVMLDTSRSMLETPEFFETARIYSVALSPKPGDLITFDCHVGKISLSGRDSKLTQAMNIEACELRTPKSRDFYPWKESLQIAHGTWTSGPVDWLISERKKIDNLIVITDGQQNQGRPFADAIAEYRNRVNGGLRLFVIDVSPNRNALTPPASPLDFYISGWSDRVLSYIPLMSKSKRFWEIINK